MQTVFVVFLEAPKSRYCPKLFGYFGVPSVSYDEGGLVRRNRRCPVTARLSRKFYEKLGEDIAQEFVDWFNMVDATYREDLRETNELNFARFDAKLEQRVAELDAKIAQLGTEFHAKIDGLGTKLDAKIEQLGTEFDAKMETGFANMSRVMEKRIASVRTDIIKWMFVFWATNALIVLGLVSRLL